MLKKIINFGFVGIIATAVDYLLLWILKEYLNIDVMIASTISFSCSLILNYVLSMRFVFTDKREMSSNKQFSIFLVTALIGLGLNQLIMYALVEKLGVYYLFAKVVATGVVLVWNFISRHLTLEKGGSIQDNEEKN